MTAIGTAAIAAILAASVTVAACGQVDAPGPGSQSAQTPPAAATPGAPPAAAATTAEPATVADLLPPGPGRDQLLNNCSSCHNLACSVIGQRTAARWDSLKESHKEKVPDSDLEAVFGYLKVRFNDANPEPKVPPKFLQGGCTPF
jgi:hypothetical protein